jgi:hypothetical protein
MLRYAVLTTALTVFAGAATAGPLELTETQMDSVTAGFVVNEKRIATFDGATGTSTIDASAVDTVLPSATGFRVWSGHINSGAGNSGDHVSNN